MVKALLIAAPKSGSGKTTVTLGLLRALKRRGLAVRAAKSGPDYIDPAFHAAACGAESVNLDSWSMAPDLMAGLLAPAAGSDILIIESAMGLFDGADGPEGRTGASADIAAALGIPVVLVMDCSGQSQSAGAVLHGFASLRPGVRVAGTILNQVASPRHARGIRAAVAPLGIPVLGQLGRDDTLTLPERHLGLVQAGEHADLETRLEQLADAAEAHLDIDGLLAAAADITLPADTATALTPPGQRIALARDAAFSFTYAHLIGGWRAAGAEITFFSPLADEAPPEGCDACWLPGGYPELHAPALAAATGFKAGLARFARTRPVHGECGGYMVLGRTLTDAEGTIHPMADLLSHATSYARRRMTLGYRRAVMGEALSFAAAGQVLRGHEFHYATVCDPGSDAPVARLTDGWGEELGLAGGRRGPVSGTFFHVIAAEAAPA
ncbi:cobyrinate a,c-diamide synthase [Radicibacter daui]|uniref:cobyrinate a,c-diamide synthase n=1 Tax=Radicibacter daui TaxID=3064829 RepID=UPI00404703D0